MERERALRNLWMIAYWTEKKCREMGVPERRIEDWLEPIYSNLHLQVDKVVIKEQICAIIDTLDEIAQESPTKGDEYGKETRTYNWQEHRDSHSQFEASQGLESGRACEKCENESTHAFADRDGLEEYADECGHS